jgi:hypothetical protein
MVLMIKGGSCSQSEEKGHRKEGMFGKTKISNYNFRHSCGCGRSSICHNQKIKREMILHSSTLESIRRFIDILFYNCLNTISFCMT